MDSRQPTPEDAQAHEADLACQELVELVTDYLEGALAPGERRRFEAHLDECPFCRRYVDQMRSIARELGRLEPETIAPEQRDALVTAFRGFRRR